MYTGVCQITHRNLTDDTCHDILQLRYLRLKHVLVYDLLNRILKLLSGGV